MINEYIESINRRYQNGISREHSYRGDLQKLLENICPEILSTNEPSGIACGNPDIIITKNDIPIGLIEAKDIGKDLSSREFEEQFIRYRQFGMPLIITDYLDFWFYYDSEFKTSIRIAKVDNNKLIPIPTNYEQFKNLILDFCTNQSLSIKSSIKLSMLMAGKARLLANVIEGVINNKEDGSNNNTLTSQMEAFKKFLIHDINPKQFADIYAQTITYGMFAARLNDKTLENFSRQEAAELIPKTNPFLRSLFNYIAGPDIDERIKWIVESLAEIFRSTDVAYLLKDSEGANNSIIHFYELFLAEYDPKLRKSRGVWYTPEPVVQFIVKAVNDILITEFGLSEGLADTETTEIELDTQTHDKRTKTRVKRIKHRVHKVQILDPATGTGTFLAEVVKQIYNKFAGQKGIWSNYVENHLIPRLNGFEILMASYAIAHLNIDLLLAETGFNPKNQNRYKIFLTNTLEEYHPDTGTLFASWLSNEASEANEIKRDTPVMCVIGNPPYSSISSNKGDWIKSLIEDYKYVDGIHFKERKHWLHDDYVKFIRFGEHFIEKNGEGILAFINNHSFIDNPTFRGMRWHLLKTFDTIYIIDLHGNSLKKEIPPDGITDKNVFDIQAGVSINIFVKTGKKSKTALAKVKHIDLWGDRIKKYKELLESDLSSLNFQEVNYSDPYYFFKQKDEEDRSTYDEGFRIDLLFQNNKTGIVTMGDGFIVADTKEELKNRIDDFLSNDYTDKELNIKYSLGKNYSKWIIENKNNIKISEKDFIKLDYRPFDTKWTIFDNKLIWRWRFDTMKHFVSGENVGIVVPKINKEDNCFFISKNIIAHKLCSAYDSNSIFPLYLYPDTDGQETFLSIKERTPNLDKKIISTISKNIDLNFVNEKDKNENNFSPIDVLDYIYAIFYSPLYRNKYEKFLKDNFPIIPYPKNKMTFLNLVRLGSQLRQLHLFESPKLKEVNTRYPIDGNNVITRKMTKNNIGFELINENKLIGRIWINDEQYFDNVPLKVWKFPIGGYQPAQKWLKDRYKKELNYEDIQYYQKIIKVLSETDNIMKEIDNIIF